MGLIAHSGMHTSELLCDELLAVGESGSDGTLNKHARQDIEERLSGLLLRNLNQVTIMGIRSK